MFAGVSLFYIHISDTIPFDIKVIASHGRKHVNEVLIVREIIKMDDLGKRDLVFGQSRIVEA